MSHFFDVGKEVANNACEPGEEVRSKGLDEEAVEEVGVSASAMTFSGSATSFILSTSMEEELRET